LNIWELPMKAGYDLQVFIEEGCYGQGRKTKPGVVALTALGFSVYMARSTFPALRHLVHTLILFTVPLTLARIF
jgi:hypothetical protein